MKKKVRKSVGGPSSPIEKEGENDREITSPSVAENKRPKKNIEGRGWGKKLQPRTGKPAGDFLKIWSTKLMGH